jgi:hypothetical protein
MGPIITRSPARRRDPTLRRVPVEVTARLVAAQVVGTPDQVTHGSQVREGRHPAGVRGQLAQQRVLRPAAHHVHHVDGLVRRPGGKPDVAPVGQHHWTLLDNLEWIFGYDFHYGLRSVDRETFVRTPKPSAGGYAGYVRATAGQPAPV